MENAINQVFDLGINNSQEDRYFRKPGNTYKIKTMKMSPHFLSLSFKHTLPSILTEAKSTLGGLA
jgi:hypothetical protein